MLKKFTGDLHEVRVTFQTEDGTKYKSQQIQKIGNYKGAFTKEIARIQNE